MIIYNLLACTFKWSVNITLNILCSTKIEFYLSGTLLHFMEARLILNLLH